MVYTFLLANYYQRNANYIIDLVKNRKLLLINKWLEFTDENLKLTKTKTKKEFENFIKNNNFIFWNRIITIQWNNIHNESRLINFLRLSIPLTNKWDFYKICRKNKQLLEYIPFTCLYKDDLLNYYNKNKNSNYWLTKKRDGTQGDGILLYNIEYIKKNINTTKTIGNHIFQEYIKNPLLLDGLKFDFRMFLLLNNDKKLYLYADFFIRRTRYPYTLKELDKRIHLTNTTIQQVSNDKIGNIKSKLANDELSLNNNMFFKLYKNQHGDNINYKNKEKLYTEIMKIVSLIFQTYKNENFKFKDVNYKKDFNNSKGYQLYGIDLMLDSNFNIYIIEINDTPSLSIHNKAELFKKNLMNDLFNLTIDPIIGYNNKKPINNFINIKY